MEFIAKFEKLKKKLAKVEAAKLSENFAIQVNMTDGDCAGAFYIAYINGIFSVEPYDYHDRTAMVTAESSVFEKMIDKKLDIEKAVSDGNAIIEGSRAHVKQVIDAIEKPAKKTPAKTKAAEKKTQVKPATPKTAEPKKSPSKKTTVKKNTSKTK